MQARSVAIRRPGVVEINVDIRAFGGDRHRSTATPPGTTIELTEELS